jgi:hypothetical protein
MLIVGSGLAPDSAQAQQPGTRRFAKAVVEVDGF